MGNLNMLSEFKNGQNRKNIDTTQNLNKYLVTKHSWHLVDPSPWPLVTALGAFTITFSLVLIMHSYKYGDQLIICGFLILLYSIYMWWRDIIREATLEEQHTFSVQRSLRLGMLLFSAGITVTWAHHAIISRAKKHAIVALIWTLFLALLFTGLQVFEYLEAPFTITDSVYGSCFYITTGFHGFHVVIGTCFLFVSFIRILFNHLTNSHHFGFEAGAWYWHFVGAT